MTTRHIEREVRRGSRMVQLVRENIETLLAVLIAAGEGEFAGQIASIMATTEHAELGDKRIAEAGAAAPRGGLRAAADGFRGVIRAKLAEMGINSLADVAAFKATVKGGGS
jgi:hypothetical protein